MRTTAVPTGAGAARTGEGGGENYIHQYNCIVYFFYLLLFFKLKNVATNAQLEFESCTCAFIL